MKKLRFTKRAVSVVMSVVIAFAPVWATAAEITYIKDTLSTLKVSELADHTIEFQTPTGVESSTDTITITFESDFDPSAIAATDVDIATSTSACSASPTYADDAVAGTAAASTWGYAVSGQVITLTAPTDAAAGTVDANTCIQVQFGTNADSGTNQITNPTTSGPFTVAIAGTFGDTGTTTVEILNDDQVQLTAEVAQSITFSISDNAQSFGTLSASAARYASTTGSAAETVAHTLTAGTNAASGYTITKAGDTLEAPGGTITAIGASPAASSVGSEQFGVKFVATGGSGAVSAPYATANYAWDSSSTTPDEIATAAGTTADTVYAATYIANIASDTEAGNYSTAITYVATANF